MMGEIDSSNVIVFPLRSVITRAKFLAATGVEPINDDLERCNCAQAGELGHWFCGWDDARNLPVFLTARGAHNEAQNRP
jgi:hypothetical protein